MNVLTAFDVLPSPARVHPPTRAPLRVGLVQLAWNPDADEHDRAITEGVRAAAREGARVVCLPELTRSPYFAVERRDAQHPLAEAEPLPGGPTFELVAACARETGAYVHASCYEAAVTAGYYEDTWFRPGDSGWPVTTIDSGAFGFPTCWDQWFPETSRALALGGAEVLVYPTAIGSEPDHPAFDTEPLWEQVIRSQGIMNGTFMVAVNRTGREGPLTFYGSSFVSDPYGRVLLQAPRGEPAVLVADLDLDQSRDWLELFPFLQTRRPDAYGPLTGRA